MDIFLSICIPTYNRAKLLERAIDHVYGIGFDFPFEVVVMDNCSDDATPKVAKKNKNRLNFRYYRQDKNYGHANFYAVMRAAKGKYCIYLADDDSLLIDGLKTSLDFLEANPSVNCVQTPWEVWNETKGCIDGHFNTTTQMNIVFNQHQFGRFYDFIIANTIYPEIGIYRTSELVKCLFGTNNVLFSYVLMGRLLKLGAVAFVPTIFYRQHVTEGAGGEEKAGTSITMDNINYYRKGLEYLVATSIEHEDVSPEVYQKRLLGINPYLFQRHYVATEYLSQARRYIDAEEALISIRAAGGGNTDQVQRLRSYVHFRAVLQSIINIVNKAPYMDGIIFCGMLSPDTVKTIIEEMKVNFNYFIKYIGEMDSIENKETYFIITGDDVDSNQLVNMGFNGNQIINETELMQIF